MTELERMDRQLERFRKLNHRDPDYSKVGAEWEKSLMTLKEQRDAINFYPQHPLWLVHTGDPHEPTI